MLKFDKCWEGGKTVILTEPQKILIFMKLFQVVKLSLAIQEGLVPGLLPNTKARDVQGSHIHWPRICREPAHIPLYILNHLESLQYCTIQCQYCAKAVRLPCFENNNKSVCIQYTHNFFFQILLTHGWSTPWSLDPVDGEGQLRFYSCYCSYLE